MAGEVVARTRGLGPSRAEVLEHLRDRGVPEPVSVIARAVGLHENTTRFHLDALTRSGLVHRQAENRQVPGRPRVLYRADPAPIRNHYAELAGALVKHYAGPMADRGELAEEAGRAWGVELREDLPVHPVAPLPRLVDCLARLGYEPELVSGPPTSIDLRPCPFLDLAGADPETVCRLHLGLLRGLLHETDPWLVTGLEPWVTPTRCVVRLAPRGEPS